MLGAQLSAPLFTPHLRCPLPTSGREPEARIPPQLRPRRSTVEEEAEVTLTALLSAASELETTYTPSSKKPCPAAPSWARSPHRSEGPRAAPAGALSSQCVCVPLFPVPLRGCSPRGSTCDVRAPGPAWAAHRGRPRGGGRVNAMDGLPAPPPGVPMTPAFGK